MKTFDEKFEEKFQLSKNNFSIDQIKFARSILSNTIGGISYFYGSSLVKSDSNSLFSTSINSYGPIQLLTAVPSRSFFPRGFLWDEGFHQILISHWDSELSMLIIKSWFYLMNNDGWIPREIILGDEAKSRVPSEFIVQHSSNANPPALLLPIGYLIENQLFNKQWLKEIYPRLKQWFEWLNTTQAGKISGTFRWRGRNATNIYELNPKTLTSGLDDYPRATHPTDDEIHIDLRCWIALASRLMAKISKILETDGSDFEIYYQLLSDNDILEKQHWSEEHQMFCDKGLHSEQVRLVKVLRNNMPSIERKVITAPHYRCIDEFGYVSLFPFMMTLLKPNNLKLKKVLDDIENPNLLWTVYGLRSLAKNSIYYQRYNTLHDGPYWRGSIWININFLVLKALNYYSKVKGPFQSKAAELHSKLKLNLVNNIYREYNRTGYVWEQYDDSNGFGKGSHPFTGWTALIVEIMSQN